MLNRIKEYLDYKKISIRKFEISIGMANGAFGTALKKGTTIHADKLETILNVYRDISAEWLMTGRGQMLLPENPMTSKFIGSGVVPFFDVDFLGGFAELYNEQKVVPDGYMSAEIIKGAECWCVLTGHSMEPSIADGDLIALKEETDWTNTITNGQMYAIITSNGLRTVKRVEKSNDKTVLKLCPDNSNYKPLEIEVLKITKVFKVLGCLHKF